MIRQLCEHRNHIVQLTSDGADFVVFKSGVDVRTLSEMLGHFSAGFTLGTYVHSTPGMKQSAADAIGNTIRNAI